ncbi:PREDICTED: uncharacterized protein LOC109187439 [Ipomoea nil]|uniref:uncharacterized protein LOC109187439 n=1 Tax=Ipomoea nil TaxID=35883 RepID=UPI000901B48C|nr:PREDICTED: uncharacterized protein LOC109187439 [Ipomoea nil]
MAALSGKVVQHTLVAKCCQQNRKFSPQYQQDHVDLIRHDFLSPLVGKLAWNGNSTMQPCALSKSNRGNFYCNAAPSNTAVSSGEKTDFLKLQNGSDIRGVAVAGVEGEPVNLTEPVTEAIAAAFAAWLLEKKKLDGSRSLRVSIGHDSRISAKKLQDAVSRGLTRAGADVIQYGSVVYFSMLCHYWVYQGKVLEPLGAITSGSQFLEPDGMFPNHIPNPEDKTAMKAITQAVLDNKADLGIIFDTDVDRSAAVDSSGHEFNRNRLIALLSAIVLEEHPGTTIVTDSVTSDGLTAFIEKKLGGKHHRFKRGYKNVIDEAIRLNSVGEESHLAIETSGHGALKENHWLDDGAYLMVKLLNKLALAKASGKGGGSKVLTDLVEGLEEPAVAVELRLKIDQYHPDLKGGSFREYGEAVLKHLETTIDSDTNLQKALVNYEGVRASGYGGWFLLRLSLHDPVLPLNIEAPSNEEAVKLGLVVFNAVKEFTALDTSGVTKFIQV